MKVKFPPRRRHFLVTEILQDGVSVKRRAACGTSFRHAVMTDEHNEVNCKGCINTYVWRQV